MGWKTSDSGARNNKKGLFDFLFSPKGFQPAWLNGGFKNRNSNSSCWFW
jgi:hypothetical protein